MWIFMNNAFLSVVAHRDAPDMVIVRARKAGDIEAAMGGWFDLDIMHTPDADYPYRCPMIREVFSRRMAQLAEEIDSPNFKDSVSDTERHDAYLEVWATMRRWQRGGFVRHEPVRADALSGELFPEWNPRRTATERLAARYPTLGPWKPVNTAAKAAADTAPGKSRKPLARKAKVVKRKEPK